MRDVRPLFEGRVLPVIQDTMLRCRLFDRRGRKTRHTFHVSVAIEVGCAYACNIVIIDTLPGFDSGVAIDINNNGWVVGSCLTPVVIPRWA